MKREAQTEELEAFLAREMNRFATSGDATKRTAVRLAIASAINSDLLPKGSLIPTEKRLTKVMGVSLGTVQAALQQLQQSGIIIRRRRAGSRVASTEALGRETWHFRLLDKDTGQPLRIASVNVKVDLTEQTGPWSDFFPGCENFVRIRRRMTMTQNVNVGAEMVLPADRVPGFATIAPSELQLVNIRFFLAEKFGLLIARADHQIETANLSEQDAKRFKLPPGILVFHIVASAYSPDATPGYWQRIIAPCDACRITL